MHIICIKAASSKPGALLIVTITAIRMLNKKLTFGELAYIQMIRLLSKLEQAWYVRSPIIWPHVLNLRCFDPTASRDKYDIPWATLLVVSR